MRCNEAQNLMALYLADDPLLAPGERLCLEEHLHDCPPCRAAHAQGLHVVNLMRQYGKISEDTLALLDQAQAPGVSTRPRLVRYILRVGAMAACLVVAVLGWWVISSWAVRAAGPESRIASSAASTTITIEGVGDEGPLSPGAVIETSTGERKTLVLNGQHQVVMNAGTRLSIESLQDRGRAGCRVNLARGEIYVQVEHDGRPFLVQTAHGRAVITGTTFDVKVTEAYTTLIVVEGSVRFESQGGTVQVLAGQQSMIAGAWASPSTSTACDGMALTAWARAADPGGQMAPDLGPDDFLWENLPTTPSSWAKIPADPDRIDYTQWIEQKRGWFQQQFPWVFELQEALGKEGIEADYPALLTQSGALWRFAYPQAGLGRQVEPDPNGLLRAALPYGRDELWLQQQAFSSLPRTGNKRPALGPAAFERWTNAIAMQANLRPSESDSGMLPDTVNACLYLANTRTLAALEFRNGFVDAAPEIREKVSDLLEEELRILAQCMQLSFRVNLERSALGACEYSQSASQLVDAIARIDALEEAAKKPLDETVHDSSAKRVQ